MHDNRVDTFEAHGQTSAQYTYVNTTASQFRLRCADSQARTRQKLDGHLLWHMYRNVHGTYTACMHASTLSRHRRLCVSLCLLVCVLLCLWLYVRLCARLNVRLRLCVWRVLCVCVCVSCHTFLTHIEQLSSQVIQFTSQGTR